MHSSATRTYQHAHYLLRSAQNKPSSPIEIPKLRKSGHFRRESPSMRPQTPEMIFEMSPINEHSNSPFASHFPLAFTASHNHVSSHPNHVSNTGTTPNNEPFLYPFPALSHSRVRPADTFRQSTDSTGYSLPSSSVDLGGCAQNRPNKDNCTPVLRQLEINAENIPRTHPISHPSTKNAAPSNGVKSRARLSRRAQPRVEVTTEPVSSTETVDRTTLDFGNFLIQRMERDRPFRPRANNPLAPLRVRSQPVL